MGAAKSTLAGPVSALYDWPMRERQRRDVLGGLVTGAGLLAMSSCARAARAAADPPAPASGEACADANEVRPVEDLMREHGVLRRVLLVYGECARRLEAGPPQDFPPEALVRSAGVVRRFVEDYHEKLEEDALFPRFRRAGRLTDLVQVLLDQHRAGRRLTERIAALAPALPRDSRARADLATALRSFVAMYEPHAAREDTVLFPALHAIIGGSEYDALGDAFEKQEKELFGADGFERVVAEVADIERSVGIEDLARFTPR
jgi:hemerythrin-like domain-containing protein